MAELALRRALSLRVRRPDRARRRVVRCVDAGELLALIGPNGAGKTSVLNCIGGIYRPATGAHRLPRRATSTASRPHAIARLGIARTFQHGELLPQMTVLDNLLVAATRASRRASLAQGPLPARRRRRGSRASRGGRGDPRLRRARALPPPPVGALPLRHPEDRRLRARAGAGAGACCCSTSPRPGSIARSARTSRGTSCASSTSSASP